MTTRRTLIAGVGIALAMTLLGCAPEADLDDPAPSFASDDEAFAAAEATYRAYVDALNERRDDPRAPDPQVFLVSRALEVDTETQRQLDQNDLAVVGHSLLVQAQGVAVTSNRTTVHMTICIDSSSTQILDDAGEDVTPADREVRSLLDVRFDFVGSELRISDSELSEDEKC